MTEQPALAIVIVNYNTLKLTQECLRHLIQTLTREAEIYIVDNGSTDGSQAWLLTLSDSRVHCVLSSENLGFAGGCNLGIKASSSKYVLLLNTDAFPKPGAIEMMIDYLEAHEDVGVVGPQLVYPDGRWQRSTGLIPTPWGAFREAVGITSTRHLIAMMLWGLVKTWPPFPAEYVDGASMLIRSQVIQEIGGLSEQFFFYIEDAEFCARAKANSWKVRHLTHCQVVHLRGKSSSKLDYERALRARVQSEETFVAGFQGQKAWRRFVYWRRVNYGWRMWIAMLLGHKHRRTQYNLAYTVYREALA